MNYNTLQLMAKPLCSLWCISTSDINTGFDTGHCIKLLIINIIIYRKTVLFKNSNYVPILFYFAGLNCSGIKPSKPVYHDLVFW